MAAGAYTRKSTLMANYGWVQNSSNLSTVRDTVDLIPAQGLSHNELMRAIHDQRAARGDLPSRWTWDARCRIKTTETITFNTIQIMASIFSRIIAGEIPSYKVAEDDRYYAFLDINPLAKGHTLVVPKKEVDYIFDLDDETLAGMMLFAKKVAARIKRETACRKVAVVVLGLEVPHAHIHLIPMNSENDVDFHREKLQLTPEEFREIAEKLSRE